MTVNKILYKKTKYKYVQAQFRNGKWVFVITFPGVTHKHYTILKKAAIAVDVLLIKKGKKPINILSKK